MRHLALALTVVLAPAIAVVLAPATALAQSTPNAPASSGSVAAAPAASAAPQSPAPAAGGATPVAGTAQPAYPYPPPGYGYPPYGYGAYPQGYAPHYAYPPLTKVQVRTEPYTGGPVPQGATLKTERSKGLLVAGGVTFGALYLSSIMYALLACPPGKEAGDCPSNSGWLYVPVVGPFATAADSSASFGGRNLAIFDGIFQLLGAGTFVFAMASGKEVLEYKETVNVMSGEKRQVASIRVAPVAPGAFLGATVSAVAF